jgi:hypothetical protein
MPKRERYIPVLRLAQSELEAMGGEGLDLKLVAKQVGNALIELGYWDVVKAVIEHHKATEKRIMPLIERARREIAREERERGKHG